ncbi:putative bifunctional diguanylate cyclase/phosphodiesterase [Aerosticca soli]|nr:EAL domain-containing protein [Aerosticca soli]
MVWPFLLMVFVQAALACLSIYVLSAVRALTSGEVPWVIGQKDALYHLDRYAAYGREEDLAAYRRNIRLPLAVRDARQALDEAHPDVAYIRRRYLEGDNHPADFAAIFWLLRHFRRFPMVQEPIRQWEIGDHYLDQVGALAAEIAARRHQGPPPDERTIEAWRSRIGALNEAMLPGIHAFREALGKSASGIVSLLFLANLLLVAGIVVFAIRHADRLLRRQAWVEGELAGEKEAAETTLAAIGDGVLTLDPQGDVVYANPAAIRLLGRTAAFSGALETLLPLDQAVHPPGQVAALFDEIRQATLPADDLRTWHLVAGAERRIVRLAMSPLYRQGQAAGAVLVLRDVTGERNYVEQLAWQASHDAMTGLANRREFERRLESWLAEPAAVRGPGAMLYIDLDQFKVINDTRGHEAGDALLRHIAGLMRAHLHADDVLARLGGDEFGVLLLDCVPLAASRLAEQLRESAAHARVAWQGELLGTTLSIGLVELGPAPGNVQEVLRVADIACYRAKERGRNTVYLYQPDDADLKQRMGYMHWVQRLRKALEEQRFCLYGQPIVPLRGASPGLHLEVLLRLRGENGQIIEPSHFVPAAEMYGLMSEIDRWTVQQVFAVLAERSARRDLPPLHVCAINLSGNSLGNEDLLDFLTVQIERHRLDPRQLCFEITETSAIAHLSNAVRLIEQLRGMGCRFALDDFGAGMASFGYLKQLRVDYLKIDGSFVRDMLDDRSSAAMVDAINRIGHVMGQRTIGEFAETQAHVEALRALGVDYAQGYAIGKPLPLDALLGETAVEVQPA